MNDVGGADLDADLFALRPVVTAGEVIDVDGAVAVVDGLGGAGLDAELALDATDHATVLDRLAALLGEAGEDHAMLARIHGEHVFGAGGDAEGAAGALFHIDLDDAEITDVHGVELADAHAITQPQTTELAALGTAE